MSTLNKKSETSFNYTRILFNAFFLIVAIASVSYGAVVITDSGVVKDGVAYVLQGGTWEDSQNANQKNLSNVQLYNSINSNTKNLTAFYALDENTGIIASESRFEKDATLINMNTGLDNCTGNCSGWTIDGITNNALRFDGINDYATTQATISPTTLDQFSLSAWVKVYSINTAVTTIVGRSKSGGGEMIVIQINNHRLQGVVRNNTNSLASIQTTTYYDNYYGNTDWHYAVITANLTHVSFYVDNKFIGASTRPVGDYTVYGSNPLYLGVANNNNAPASDYFNGSVDNVKVFSKALSTQEIQAEYLTGGLLHKSDGDKIKDTGDTIRGQFNITDPTNSSNVYCQKWINNVFTQSTDPAICG